MTCWRYPAQLWRKSRCRPIQQSALRHRASFTSLSGPRHSEQMRQGPVQCESRLSDSRTSPRPLAGGVGGRDGEFTEHAPCPSSDSGVQAGMRPAREGNGYDFHYWGCLGPSCPLVCFSRPAPIPRESRDPVCPGMIEWSGMPCGLQDGKRIRDKSQPIIRLADLSRILSDRRGAPLLTLLPDLEHTCLRRYRAGSSRVAPDSRRFASATSDRPT